MVDYPQTGELPRRWDWFPVFVFGALLAMVLGLIVAMTLGS